MAIEGFVARQDPKILGVGIELVLQLLTHTIILIYQQQCTNIQSRITPHSYSYTFMPLLLLVRMQVCSYYAYSYTSSSASTNLNKCVFLYSIQASLFVIFPYKSKYLRYLSFKNHRQNSRNARLQPEMLGGYQGRGLSNSGRWLGPVTYSTFLRQKLLHSEREHLYFLASPTTSYSQFLLTNSRMTFFVIYPHIFLSQSHLFLTFSFFIFLNSRSPFTWESIWTLSASRGLGGRLRMMLWVNECMGGSKTRDRSRSGTSLRWGKILPRKESADLLLEIFKNMAC